MPINTWADSLSAKRPVEFPAEAEREYPVWGSAPPAGYLAADGAFYTALLTKQALEQARGLEYALTGAESNGITATPSAGHKHDEGYDAIMPWNQLGSWHLWMNNASTLRGSRAVNETSETTIGTLAFVLPDGATRAAIRLRVYIPSGSTINFRCKLRFDTPATVDSATPALDGGYISAQVDTTRTSEGFLDALDNTTISGNGARLTSDFFDLSGLATTNGKRVVLCRLSAAVNSGTAYVAEAQALLPEIGARAHTVKQSIKETLGLPAEVLDTTSLYSLWTQNPERIRQLIWGLTDQPRRSAPHDHGATGGELLSRHLASYLFGPHRPEGDGVATGGTEGIPIVEPATSVDFTVTPKLLVQAPLFVLGRVSQVRVRLLVALPGAGTRTLSLKVEARPISDQGYSAGGRFGVTTTAAFSFSGTRYAETSVTLDLSTLGHTHEDRLLEFCIWQVSNPPAASTYRLLSALVIAEALDQTVQSHEKQQTREEISPALIREGVLLSTRTLAKSNRVLNQLAWETLHGVPGLDSDLRTPATSKPWRALLEGPHQHRGTYTDASGNTVHDGIPLRYPLVMQHFGVNVAGNSPEASTASADPVLGHPLGSGTFVSKVTIPRGLTSFDLYLLLQPLTTAEQARLIVSLRLFGPGKAITAISTPGDVGIIRTLTFAADTIRVHPDDSDSVWQNNSDRLAAGLGLWTADAKITTASLPTGTSTTNAARWTKPIRVEFAPPASQPWCAAYDYELHVAANIETGAPGSGTFDTTSRLLALIAIPSRS